MSVPSNLIPTTILQLPEDPNPSDTGWMVYVNAGNTYKVQVNALLNVSGVPTTRVVATGAGLTGGGALSSNLTISVAPGGIGASQLNVTGVNPGVYGDSTNFPSFTVDANGRLTSAGTFPAPSTSGFVPTSREVLAGAGLLGGGPLTSDVVLAADLSDLDPLAVGTTSPGTSLAISREDHVHPAIDLSDTTQTDGILDPTRGGTGTALTTLTAGGVVYTNGAALRVTGAGTPGQVLYSTGSGSPIWATISGTGTVTSVNVSGGTTGLSFTGGPITTTGTMTMSGTLDLDNGGTGSTTAAGARANLSAAVLGLNNDITSLSALTGGISTPTYIDWAVGGATLQERRMSWNNTDGTLDLLLKGGNVTLPIGQELVQRVYNNTGSTLVDGQVVIVSGSQGQRLTVALAQANADLNSATILGVVTEHMPNNTEGFVTVYGVIKGVNTSGIADGTVLWLSPTTPGAYTATKPVAPNHLVMVGYVVKGDSVGGGSIYVHVQNGYELDELHDVLITAPKLAGQTLIYDGTVGVWKNNRLTAGTGITVTNGDASIGVGITSTGVTANTYGSASVVPVFAVNAQGQITSVTNTSIAIANTAVSGLGTSSTLNAGVAGGVATLDGGGTVPTSQLPAAVLGAVKYQGTWNASTNTPTLASGVGTKGYYYVVDVAGSTNLDGITDWKIGDWAIYSGTAWQKIDNTDAVTSVNGYTGTVVLAYTDVGAPSTTGTNATGTWGISISGTAANATNSVNAANAAVTADATNASRYLTFVGATSGNNGVLADSDLSYNPSTNTLSVGTLVATAGLNGGTF